MTSAVALVTFHLVHLDIQNKLGATYGQNSKPLSCVINFPACHGQGFSIYDSEIVFNQLFKFKSFTPSPGDPLPVSVKHFMSSHKLLVCLFLTYNLFLDEKVKEPDSEFLPLSHTVPPSVLPVQFL